MSPALRPLVYSLIPDADIISDLCGQGIEGWFIHSDLPTCRRLSKGCEIPRATSPLYVRRSSPRFARLNPRSRDILLLIIGGHE